MSRAYRQIIVLTALFLLQSAPAYAYLDPGSVSLAVQALVASVAGISLTGKYWFWRILRLLGLRKNRQDTDSKDPEDE